MNNLASQKELSAKLVRLYILALCGVALFSIIGQVMIQVSISEQQDDARVINIAGRQRMLSQRLCKTTILLTNPQIFRPDAEHYSQDIKDIIELWSKCHNGLKNGILKLDDKTISVKNSPKIDSMFYKLDPIFQIILVNAKIIEAEIDTPSVNKSNVIGYSLSQILQNERSFLKMMDKIVFQYDIEAKKRVEKLKNSELLLFSLTLIILLLEGIFIFRPTYQQINQTIDSISQSEKNLQKLNHQLQISNSSLIKAENELLKATEEKYKIQIKEDKIRSASLIEGQEEERKRLSLELHDGIGQMLTGLKLAAEKLNTENFNNDKDKKTLSDLKHLLNDTIAETRVISFNLMPSVLNDFGVISAIKLLAEQAEKNSTTQIKFSYSQSINRLPKNIEITIYRIAQECINNCMKHANAKELNISLVHSENIIKLLIADNGKGFDLRKLRNKSVKNGINNMRSRTEINNGEFKISSRSEKGTKILVKLPL
jgi:signal transduction histidine kinase